MTAVIICHSERGMRQYSAVDADNRTLDCSSLKFLWCYDNYDQQVSAEYEFRGINHSVLEP